MTEELNRHTISIPKANRDRVIRYDWKQGKGGGWQTRGGWFLNQMDPPWADKVARPFVDDTDFDGEFYHVKVTREGVGQICGDLLNRGGFADLFRKEIWPFIRAYIDNPPK